MILVMVLDAIAYYGNTYIYDTLGFKVVLLADDIVPIVYIINCLNWVKFIDAVVNNDEKGLKDRYRLSILPIIFLVFLAGIEKVISNLDNEHVLLLYTLVYAFTSGGTSIFYMFKGYHIARKYQKEIKNPFLLRLDIFIVPWVIGMFSMKINMDHLCQAIGLLLTFWYVNKRYEFFDKYNVFYNEHFVDYLDKYDKKHGINGGYAIILYSEDEDVLSETIEKSVTRENIVVRTDEDYFIIYTHIRLKSAIQLMIITIQDAASKIHPDINIEAQFLLLSEGEGVIELTNRLKARLTAYDRLSHM